MAWIIGGTVVAVVIVIGVICYMVANMSIEIGDLDISDAE